MLLSSLHLRSGPGLIYQPNGLKLYQGLLEFYTTIPGISAEEIYAMGLTEIG